MERHAFCTMRRQDIAQHLETCVDLILFHAVLEWVADPLSVLQTLWSMLRPGGTLSLMFYNANGFPDAQHGCGQLRLCSGRNAEKEKRTLSRTIRADPQQVYGLAGRDWLADNREDGRRVFMIICVKNTNSVTV